jgi:hypothetical protein
MSAITNARHVLFSLISLLLFLLPSSALAISFTPTAADLAVMPGETATQSFTITSNATSAQNYTTSSYLVHFNSDTHEPIFDAWPTSMNSWVVIDTTNFTLQTNEQKNISMTLSIPADAADTSLVIGLIIREVAEVGALNVTSGVSSLVFVTIGQPTVNAVLTSFSPSSLITNSLPVDLTTNIINSGDRTLQSFGTVTVYNVLSKRVATLSLNPTQRRIPAGQDRSFTATWGASRQTGNFFQEFWREVTNPRIGLFTAELLAAPYPDGEVTLSQTSHIIVLPWRVLLVIIGLGTAMTITVRRPRDRR